MNKFLLQNCFFFLLYIVSGGIFVARGQNIALTATATQSGGGVTIYGPTNYNDDVIATYSNLPWGWVNTNGWIEYTWSSAQTMTGVKFYNSDRQFNSLTIEYYNGSGYVFVQTATSGPLDQEITVTFATPVTGTRLRFNNIGSHIYNPNFREIQVFGQTTCSGTPNGGFVQASSGTVGCGGTVTLSLTGQSTMNGIAHQWQYNTGTGWVDFGADTATVTSPVLTANTQFRCQLTCTSAGGGTAYSAVAPVTVTPITVSLGNDTSLCPGVSRTLDASNVAGSAYLWSTSATLPAINISNPGTYTVRVTQPNGCIGRDTIVIRAGVQPQNFLQPQYALCEDSSVTLDAGNGSGFRFLWTPGNTTAQTLNTTVAGNYNVLITSADNCELNASTSLTERPKPPITLPAAQSICSVDSVLMDVAHPIGQSYRWNTGAVTPAIWARDSGLYKVTVTSAYGCVNRAESYLAYEPDPLTDGFSFVPFFYEELGKVTFTPINPQYVTAYLWEFGDGHSSELQTPTHHYQSSGVYQVKLTVYNPCTESSYTQHVQINLPAGIAATGDAADIQIYPVPASDRIKVKSVQPGVRLEHIHLYNAVGALVYEAGIAGNAHEIAVEHLPAGMYHVRVQTSDRQWIVKKIEIVR